MVEFADFTTPTWLIILLGFTIGGLTLVNWIANSIIAPINAYGAGRIPAEMTTMAMIPVTFFFVIALVCIVVFIISHSQYGR